MRRLLMMASVFVLSSVVALPAGAVHDEDLNAPIIPWQHPELAAAEPIQLTVGDSIEVGARFGACSPGLARSFTHAADVEVIDRGTPTAPAGWSAPMRPTVALEDEEFHFRCGAATGETGWFVYWVDELTFNTEGVFYVTVQLTINRRYQDGFGFVFDKGFTLGGPSNIGANGTLAIVVSP